MQDQINLIPVGVNPLDFIPDFYGKSLKNAIGNYVALSVFVKELEQRLQETGASFVVDMMKELDYEQFLYKAETLEPIEMKQLDSEIAIELLKLNCTYAFNELAGCDNILKSLFETGVCYVPYLSEGKSAWFINALDIATEVLPHDISGITKLSFDLDLYLKAIDDHQLTAFIDDLNEKAEHREARLLSIREVVDKRRSAMAYLLDYFQK